MATLTVPGQFPTIAAAIAQAAPNDVVLIDASYQGNETATVTVGNLTVTAPSSVPAISLVLGSGTAGVILGGDADISVTGNNQANSIIGNSGDNNLNGGSGQDHYFGLAGNDVLVGGGGADFDIADYSLDAANGGFSGIIANQSAMRVQGGIDPDTVIDGFGSVDSIVGVRNIVATDFADRLYGGNNANVLQGLGGDDFISGGGGSDVLDGGAGNDTLIGGAGNDTLAGGTGLDVATYASADPGLAAFRQSYDFSGNLATGGTVTGTGAAATASGTDSVSGIEKFVFVDGVVEADVSSSTAQAYRLYDAAFDRAPDAQGFNFFVDALDNGATTTSVAASFSASAEFQAAYGSLTNQAFVEQLYLNVLNRAGETSGVSFWTNELDAGRLTRGDVLAGFSESTEHVELLRPVVEQGLFNVDATAAQVDRLYESAFDRTADADGLRFFTDALKSGAQTLSAVADSFVGSTEFVSTFGNLSNAQFVEQLYENTFARPGDAEGSAFWNNALDTGTLDRGDVLVGFAESIESKALTAPGQDGILVA